MVGKWWENGVKSIFYTYQAEMILPSKNRYFKKTAVSG